jgi:RHS repeat-associated protein
VVTQNYDNVGRIASIADGQTTYLSGLSYNAAGETLGMTMGNSVNSLFTYNDHLQLQSLRYFKTGAAQDVLNLGYDYTSATQANNNGQIQAMHYYTQPNVEDQTKSESFTYDAWSRLKAAQTLTVDSNTPGTWSLAWTYDRLGNRLSQSLVGGNVSIGTSSFAVDPATNRINGFSYDLAGNMTGDGVNTYSYDGANRLKQIDAGAAAYTYFGPLRIKKVNGGATTIYIYSSNKPIAEYVGSTNPTLSKEYIYAGSTLLATIAGTNTTYHHPDHLSNRAETDANGALIRSFGHFPYGETWYESSADPLKFTGYTRDSGTGESGLDYAMFRLYNSGHGRFTSADLLAGNLEAPESLNRYAYVENDPLNLLDPLGLTDDCGGSCTPFSYDIGAGCYITVRYTTVFDSTTKEYHSMPDLTFYCKGSNGQTTFGSLNGPTFSGAPRDHTCVGTARVLTGNPKTVGKTGGAPPSKVARGSAAAIPQQFGFDHHQGYRFSGLPIFGTVGDGPSSFGLTQSFDGVTDTIGSNVVSSPQDTLMNKNPGSLILELVTGHDAGVAPVEITVPGFLKCPGGTREK